MEFVGGVPPALPSSSELNWIGFLSSPSSAQFPFLYMRSSRKRKERAMLLVCFVVFLFVCVLLIAKIFSLFFYQILKT
jgi:hypothetical protein